MAKPKMTLRQIMTHKAKHRMLNADLFRIHITNDPKSQCGAPAMWWDKKLSQLMDCPLSTDNTHYNVNNLIAYTQI
jgi:hypothetical protein